jgi:hypothetical protein
MVERWAHEVLIRVIDEIELFDTYRNRVLLLQLPSRLPLLLLLLLLLLLWWWHTSWLQEQPTTAANVRRVGRCCHAHLLKCPQVIPDARFECLYFHCTF